MIALIPARSGSKRSVGKNVRPVAGHPLMAYSIAAARQSGVFDGIYVSTDSEDYAAVALRYGADVIMRPDEYAGDLSPDYYWVRHALAYLAVNVLAPESFAILRPTSPLRQPETIQRAFKAFSETPCDSLRAVQPCKEHPNKEGVGLKGYIQPYVLNSRIQGQPSHSVPYQLLPRVYAQNASLEMAHTRVVTEDGNISGNRVLPFFTEGFEGFDINRDEDFIMLETLLDRGMVKLPEVMLAR